MQIITVLTALVTSLLASLGAYLLAERRMAREYRLQFQAETIVRKLLKHPKWRLRTFKTIQYHIGGFTDDELRRILVQAGALRFTDATGTEIWGLIERTGDLLDQEAGTRAN